MAPVRACDASARFCGGSYRRKQVTMSRSGILDALRNEEQSLRSQLVAIQRAIEAIEGSAPPVVGRGRKKAAKKVARRKRAMTEEQGGRRADAQLLGLPASGQGAGRKDTGVTYVGRLFLARGPESGSTTSGDTDRRAGTACSPASAAAVSAGPARVMRSRTWRRPHTYSSIRDAHRAAARVPSLGTGFQPRGEGHGAVRSDAGDRREGAPPDAALRQRRRPRALSHHYRRERLEVRRLLRLPYRGFVPVTPPTVGLNEDQTLDAPAPRPSCVSLRRPRPGPAGKAASAALSHVFDR